MLHVQLLQVGADKSRLTAGAGATPRFPYMHGGYVAVVLRALGPHPIPLIFFYPDMCTPHV